MLAQTLQILERDGFDRDAKPVIPPRVDYSLTPMGREVAEQVWVLSRWVEERLDDVVKARDAYATAGFCTLETDLAVSAVLVADVPLPAKSDPDSAVTKAGGDVRRQALQRLGRVGQAR